MNGIRVRNVHRALPLALELMRISGDERQSRNGPVLAPQYPVFTTYERPLERVLFWPERDANPFFHFYEALWMLAGRDDVESMTRFVADFSKYSDNGVSFHGTYGPRWRAIQWWSGRAHDQLRHIAEALRANPDDRRQVLQMWDSAHDAPMAASGGRDVPCNLTATFQVDRDGRLNLVVFCRSNDIVLGCYGANAVQFAFLLELVASWAGYEVGTYTQISVNWHGYRSTYDPLLKRMVEAEGGDIIQRFDRPSPYEEGTVRAYPLRDREVRIETWLNDLQTFTSTTGYGFGEHRWEYKDPFFVKIAMPMMKAHDVWKSEQGETKYQRTIRALEDMPSDCDWRVAAQEWVLRRYARWATKQGGTDA